MNSILKKLENDYMSVTIYYNAETDLYDKKHKIKWHMGPVAIHEDSEVNPGYVWTRQERSICEQYPGRFQGEKKGKYIRYILLGRLGKKVGTFDVDYRLNDKWLEVEIISVDNSIPNLMFPTPVESESLVVPKEQGHWFREPVGNRWLRYMWQFLSTVNMRWFGGLRGDKGWLGIVEKGYADAGVMATIHSICPVWQKSLGSWNYKKIIRYAFTDNGYVGIAKAFRHWAKSKGLVKTLKEKIEESLALSSLVGGRMLSIMQCVPFQKARFDDRLTGIEDRYIGKQEGPVVLVTHKQAKKIIKEAKKLGMKKGMFSLHGWIKGGYDETHPDIWPPEPKLGTISELNEICAEKAPYVVNLHDNYQDIYEQCPSFPHGTVRLRDGLPMPGGIWAGGQAYILNSKNALEYAKRNWKYLKTLGMTSIYFDTATAEEFKESWEKGNRQTRAQDEKRKVQLLNFFKSKGIIVGSENGMDFGVPYTDWAPNSPHRHISGQSIPLWPLVFHDCMLNIRGVGWGGDVPAYEKELKRCCLENMLWGYMLSFYVSSPEQWSSIKKAFSKTYYADKWHAGIAVSEMVNHKFMTDDFLVEQTEFASGDAIIVNFSNEKRKVDGVVVPANGYKLRK